MKIAATEEIEIAIARYFQYRRCIIVPNISWGLGIHECDVLIIRNSGYAIEVEIKRSKSDLLNDFKKVHNHQSNKIKEFYYAIPKEYYEEWKDIIPSHAGILVYHRNTGDNIAIWQKKNAVKNKGCRKLSEEEIFKAAKLGCMRIWNLKQRLYNTKGKGGRQ
jgi:hypothetical protein